MARLPKDVQAELIGLAMEAEAENYNDYWLLGLVEKAKLFDKRNKPYREQIFKFLAETDYLTQRLYLELIYFRSRYEEIFT
ncbi:MAG: hypothetical protein II304_02710 [Bacteroidales bacterium]|nr:hypothetical protein [Bacteroidales bacterium]